MDKTSGAVDTELLTTSEVARILNLSADRIRDLERTGLLPAMKTRSGQRLFRPEHVSHLADERARSPRGQNPRVQRPQG